MVTITTERGTREVNTIEEAKGIIIGTATVRNHDKDGLRHDPDIIALAKEFGIDLDKISVEPNLNPYGYAFKYAFND